VDDFKKIGSEKKKKKRTTTTSQQRQLNINCHRLTLLSINQLNNTEQQYCTYHHHR
jgi:hypothetical protein